MAETALDTPLAVELNPSDLDIRFTPRELRTIREQVGRSFSEVIADDAADEKFVIVAWLTLRRNGYDVDWEAMDDVVISLVTPSAPDPTNGQPAAT